MYVRVDSFVCLYVFVCVHTVYVYLYDVYKVCTGYIYCVFKCICVQRCIKSVRFIAAHACSYSMY